MLHQIKEQYGLSVNVKWRDIFSGKVGHYSVLQYVVKLMPYSASIRNCFFTCRACVTIGYLNITLLHCRMEELQQIFVRFWALLDFH
jgi:hypothetical protein